MPPELDPNAPPATPPATPPVDPPATPPATPPADPPATPPAPKAPEKYDFKAPEGQTFNEVVLDAYSAAARDADLTQESAQKFLDTVAPVIAKQQADAVAAMKAGWVESAKADKELIAGNFDENVALAKKARDTFGTPEFRDLINSSGLGDHPEFLRVFMRIGKQISEDGKIVKGDPPKDAPKTTAQRMYPNMNP